jgi:hypothetical protein
MEKMAPWIKKQLECSGHLRVKDINFCITRKLESDTLSDTLWQDEDWCLSFLSAFALGWWGGCCHFWCYFLCDCCQSQSIEPLNMTKKKISSKTFPLVSWRRAHSYISLFKTVELPLLATKETGKVITGNFVLRAEKKKAEMDMEWLIGSKILLSTLRMK